MTIRRYTIWLLLVQILVWTLVITPSLAQASGGETTRLRNQIENLRRNLARVTKDYKQATDNLHETGKAVKKAEANLEGARENLSHSKKVFNDRMTAFYVQGDLGYLEVLLGSSDFAEFLDRFTYVSEMAEQDREFIARYFAQEQRYTAQQKQLAAKRSQQKELQKSLKSKEGAIAADLDEQTKLLAKYEARAKAEVQASSLRRYRHVSRGDADYFRGNRGGRVGAGFVFPVGGAHGFSNDWGAPRRGHRHQGTDIFARRGTPAVAVVSGSVRTHHSGTGGKTIYLRGDDGNTYIYIHLSGYAVTGGRVGRGQTIGYVGSTGNASASSPHLHFEIHPGGGRAINPYPILRRAG